MILQFCSGEEEEEDLEGLGYRYIEEEEEEEEEDEEEEEKEKESYKLRPAHNCANHGNDVICALKFELACQITCTLVTFDSFHVTVKKTSGC